MLGFVGLTVMDRSVGGVTVRVAIVLEIPPDAAVIVVVPAAIAVASPSLLMEATEGTDEVQVADVVRFCVLLSE
jgi:hypothetical protein